MKTKIMFGSAFVWVTDHPEKFIEKNGQTVILDPCCRIYPVKGDMKSVGDVAIEFDKQYPNHWKWYGKNNI